MPAYPNRMADNGDIKAAVERWSAGEVVAIPTETVYGLAAPINSPEGLEAIFRVKERPFFDPLILHVASVAEARTLTTNWNPVADLLAQTFWPGPLSLVLPKSNRVPEIVTAGLSTVAIRMPAHPIALSLIVAAQAPLAAPSANKFGKTSPTLAEHVRNSLPGVYVVDGGECDIGIESTVVDFPDAGKSELRVLRPGMISKAQLESVIRRLGKNMKVTRLDGSAASPGTLKHHYQPQKPLRILKDRAEISPNPSAELVLGDSPAIAARRLYAEIHRLDSVLGIKEILVVHDPAHAGEEWEPIWDRLRRAENGD